MKEWNATNATNTGKPSGKTFGDFAKLLGDKADLLDALKPYIEKLQHNTPECQLCIQAKLQDAMRFAYCVPSFDLEGALLALQHTLCEKHTEMKRWSDAKRLYDGLPLEET